MDVMQGARFVLNYISLYTTVSLGQWLKMISSELILEILKKEKKNSFDS